jgi:hypothetical protein
LGAVEGGTYRVEAAPNVFPDGPPEHNVVAAGPGAGFCELAGGGRRNLPIESAAWPLANTTAAQTPMRQWRRRGGRGGSAKPQQRCHGHHPPRATLQRPVKPGSDQRPLAGSIAGTAIRDRLRERARHIQHSGRRTHWSSNIVVTFSPAPTYTLAGAFTIN